MHVKKSCIY